MLARIFTPDDSLVSWKYIECLISENWGVKNSLYCFEVGFPTASENAGVCFAYSLDDAILKYQRCNLPCCLCCAFHARPCGMLEKNKMKFLSQVQSQGKLV